MIKIITPDEALRKNNSVFVDVRAPIEFNEATIPGAVNIPIFDDKERALLGEVYNSVSSSAAMEKGLEIVSAKLPKIYFEFKKLKENYKNIIIFCWRGGMRSRAITSILQVMKMDDVFLLEGGYKGYRKYIYNKLNIMNFTFDLIVLHGMTGTGKTKVLQILEEKGLPVINIEQLAQNRGSVFGNLGLSSSISQKMFDSLLFNKIAEINYPFAFVEAESRRIGNLYIPNRFFAHMKEGIHILIEAPIELRIQRIMEEYVYNNPVDVVNIEDIKNRIMRLKDRLGKDKCKLMVELLSKRDFNSLIKELLLNYYDPLYQYSENKVSNFKKTIIAYNLHETANDLINYVKNEYNFSV